MWMEINGVRKKNKIKRIKHEVVPYYSRNINRIFEIEEDTTVIKYFQDFPGVLLSVWGVW